MPVQKPSAHRFLLSSKPAQKPPPKPPLPATPAKPPDTRPHNRHSTPRAPDEPPLKKPTPAKRFVLAPQTHRDDTHEEARLSTPRPKPRLDRLESIEDAAGNTDNEGSEEEILFELDEDPHQHRNKRRRTDHADASTETVVPEPPAARTINTPTPARALPFLPPTGPPTSGFSLEAALQATAPTTTAAHRPHFILPSAAASPQRLSKPLPELFSPSRKANRYVVGGLAATAQAWIVDMAEQGGRGGVPWGREREDGVKVKVRVGIIGGAKGNAVECVPGGVVFMRGCVDSGVGEGDEVAVLLSGTGGARGVGSVSVKAGCLLGIKAPVWDVVIGGEKWTVGVDWMVL